MLLSLFILLAIALALSLCVVRAPVRIYTGQGASPCIYPELARTDAVILAPGTYAQWTVMGQATTLTTANDVQTLTFGGTPTGGTFRLSFNGVLTDAITFDTTVGGAPLAENIRAALAALPQVGTGNVTVSSSLTVPAVTFAGDLAGRWQPLILVADNSMTSGTTATLSIAHTTPGRQVGGSFREYDDAQTDGTNIARGVLEYSTVVTPDGRHYHGTLAGGLWTLSAPIYIAGYFRTADLIGIDAAAVTDLGRIVEGAVGSLSNVGTVLKIN
jgi:hypothetical protein